MPRDTFCLGSGEVKLDVKTWKCFIIQKGVGVWNLRTGDCPLMREGIRRL